MLGISQRAMMIIIILIVGAVLLFVIAAFIIGEREGAALAIIRALMYDVLYWFFGPVLPGL
jgi:hypothetical protein